MFKGRKMNKKEIKERIKSLEEIYREESLNSNHNGFNGLKEEDYNK
jgi:hypothetical protein